MRRLAPAVIHCLVFILAGFVQAQTCPPPVVTLVGGANPTCAGQPVSLDAGTGWSSYQWSPGGASTRMISDTPSVTTSYTVTTTDANGCMVTSQPLTVVVNAGPAAPVIHVMYPDMCANGWDYASIDPPTGGGSWQSIAWTADHAAINFGAGSNNVQFTGDGSGQPVVVHVAVQDASSCQTTVSASIPIRTISAPIVHVMYPDMCANGWDYASIDPPAGGGSWQSIAWTADHATINFGAGSTNVQFTGDGSGQPVVVHVHVKDYSACEADGSATVPIRTISAPIVHVMYPDMCANGWDYATIDPPAGGGSWQSITWTAEHATINFGAGSTNVQFSGDGSGQPVIMHVHVKDYSACEADGSAAVPIRTISAPIVHVMYPDMCANGWDYATIDPPAGGGSWQSITWTADHATINFGADSTNVQFSGDGSGQPVVVHVHVKDYSACEADGAAAVSIRSISAPAIHTLQTDITSTGSGYASIDGPASGGSWNNIAWSIENGSLTYGAGSQNVSFTADGSGQAVVLHVQVQDYSSCQAQSSITIPIRAVTGGPAIEMLQSTICVGGYSGASIADAPPANPYQSISWTIVNGTINFGQGTTHVGFQADGTENAVVLTVTVQDSSGTGQSSVTIPTRTPTPVVLALQPGSCPTSASVTNASDYTSFNWSADGAQISGAWYGPSITFLPNRNGHVTLTVVATDAGGCQSTGSIGFDASGLPDVTFSFTSSPYCYNRPGTASVPDGGPGVTYQWSIVSGQFTSGTTSPTVTFIPKDEIMSLTVVATNAGGCSSSSTATFFAPLAPTDGFSSVPASVCANGTATISTNPNATGFAWEIIDGDILSGAGTRAITFRAHTAPTVTIRMTKYESGCGNTFQQIIPVSSPNATISASGPTTCAVGSVTLTANAGSSYLWSNGATTQSVTASADGSFSVTVTDSSGCSATSAPTVVTMNANPTATITAGGPTTFCAGGSVTLTASSGSSYLWSNGAATPSITANASGSFSVTVTNANGCSATSAATVVTANANPTASITASGPTTICAGGSVTLTASSGSSYLWSNGATTPSISVNAAGSYTVNVTTASGCSATSAPTVVAVSTPVATITASGPTTLCAGGSVTLTANNGGAGYLWSTGATTQAIAVSSAGTYSVTVTDGAGCAATASQTVATDTFAVTVSPTSAHICDNNGGYQLTASQAATYLWSTGETTRQILVRTAGVYSVTATDATGCSSTSAGVPVTVSPAPHVTATISKSSVCQYQQVTITGTVTGGSGVYTKYELYDNYYTGVVATSTTSPVFTVMVLGNDRYSIVAYDANGCVSNMSDMVTVTALSPPAHSFAVDVSTYLRYPACPDAGATVSVNFPSEYASFLWSTGETTGSIVVHTPGRYSVTATTAGGCVYSGSADVAFLPPAQKPTVTASGPTTICDGNSVTLTSSPASSYFWSNGATTQSITITPSSGSFGSTPYTVTTGDANGCSASSDPVTVSFSETPWPVAYAALDNTCGTTSATVYGFENSSRSTVGDTYLWSNGATTPSIVINSSGTYHVTITTAHGCSAVSNEVPVVFNAALVAAAVAQTPTTICPGTAVTLTAQVTGGVAPYTYRWYSNDSGIGGNSFSSQQTVTITPTMSCWFYVQVVDVNNCVYYSPNVNVTLNAPPVPTISASGPTSFCPGGSVTLTAPAGYTYLWSNGATTQAVTISAAGIYTVTVTNAAGCHSTSGPFSIALKTAPPTPAVTAGGPTTFCAGGSVTLTAPAGYTYGWSTGATTQTVSVNASGSYSVTVTNANGCSATSAATVVTVNAAPVTSVTASGPTTFCPGGSVTLTAPAGYSYSWSTGATTQAITVSSAGNYHVTVTDGVGCSATSPNTVVTVSSTFTPTIAPAGNVSICTPGYVYLSAPTGGGIVAYLWSTGETTSMIQTYTAGSYTVTVTFSNGCTATSQPTVVTVLTSPPKPIITPSGSTTLCPGSNVTLTASSGYSAYHWSNGATTQSILVAAAGGFNVIGYAANGCATYSDSVFVSTDTPSTPAISTNGPTTFCAGGSVTLSASLGNSYLWSNGATTASISVGASGSYTVAVTDAGGCSATSAPKVVTVNPVPPTPAVTASGPTAFCPGGSVTLTAPAGYSYSWSTGSSAQSITVNAAGSYTVTVTDGNGCSSLSSPVAVSILPNPPTPALTASGPTSFCTGGSVTLTAPAGYAYAWSTGATTQSILVTTTGAFRVIVTDGNGCTASSVWQGVLLNANPPTPVITAGGPTTFCSGGSVTLTAPDPPAGYSYAYTWSTGATTQSIAPSTSGSYSVTIKDVYGCSATSAPTAVTVDQPSTPTITAGGPTTFCAGANVTLTASSGSSYLWSTGATTSSITASSSGSYSVTVTDANGCSATSSTTVVTVNPNPTATVTAGGPTTFCAGGSVTLTASSGSSYLWSTGATTSSITVSVAGSYSVTVTNANGCSATSAATAVTVNANPTATVTAGGPTTFCTGGSVTLTASSGSSYLWSTGGTTSSITVSASGSYSVTVTNANGCSATSTATAVTVNANPTATVTAGGPTTFCAGGSVTLTASSGSSYLWSTGATTSSITVSAAGSYSVTVTSANGCSATSTATAVTVNTNPTATITAGGPTTFCAGGSVTLTASSGSSYLWSTGATTSAITVSTAGSYTVTITDANGCRATSTATAVAVNANPTATIAAGGPTTFCAGGSVTLTASSGSSYLWSTGATTASITASATGSYSVTVTDANGCSATSSSTAVTVNANPAATVTAGGPTSFCPGGSVTLTASSGSSYLWSTGATTAAITVSAAGNYSVTVTNAAGCSATSAATSVTIKTAPATPTITAGGPTTFCVGGSVTLTAPAGFTYLWSTGATTQAITASTSGSYTVTVTNGNGCSATSAATVVTSNAKPNATITAGGPTTFCASGSVTLTSSSGSSYLWSTGATTSSITVSAAGSYSVTVTNAAGCSATSAATVVTVNANPATPTITAGGPTTFCAGGSVTLTAPAGFTYTWSTGATTQAITASTAGSYTVTVHNTNGCSATSAATVVTVNSSPSITSFSPTTQSVNKNQIPTAITVVASGTGTKTYQWYKGASGTTTNPISGATSTSFSPPTNTRGTFNYWVRVTIGTCTANSATATVTVN